MGGDDNGKTPLTGVSGALQVWANFMYTAAPRSLNMTPPDNVVMAWVDAYSGLGSAQGCPGAVQMPYIRGSEPLVGESCDKPIFESAPAESVKSWIRSWLN